MSGSPFPEGLFMLQVIHHIISQPSATSWELAFPSWLPFRGMLLTVCDGACGLAPRAQWVPEYPRAFLHFYVALSRRRSMSIKIRSVTGWIALGGIVGLSLPICLTPCILLSAKWMNCGAS